MGEDVKAFMEKWGLKCGEAFFSAIMPCYACYIDEKGDLFVMKPEWDDYKWVDEMWLDYIMNNEDAKIWRAI